LGSLGISSSEIEHLSSDYWLDLFTRQLPDFNWPSMQAKVDCAEYAIILRRDAWYSQGWTFRNPVRGAMLGFARQSDLSITVEKSDNMAVKIINGSQERQKEINDMLHKRYADAIAHGKTLVYIRPDKEGHYAVFFASGAVDNNEQVPLPFVLASAEQYGELVVSFQEALIEAAFFEGLREQLDVQCGLQCPLRALYYSHHCCGSEGNLARLWASLKEAGKQLDVPPNSPQKPPIDPISGIPLPFFPSPRFYSVPANRAMYKRLFHIKPWVLPSSCASSLGHAQV
jgi:hypothetical protein